MHITVDKAGYHSVALSRQGKNRRYLVHRLVFMAFHGPIPVGYHVNHCDGDKSHNHIENLKAVTPQENEIHSYAVLGKKAAHGTSHYAARLTEAIVLHMRREYQEIRSYRLLGLKYDVDLQTARRAIRGETWRHLREEKDAGIS